MNTETIQRMCVRCNKKEQTNSNDLFKMNKYYNSKTSREDILCRRLLNEPSIKANGIPFFLVRINYPS